MRWHNVPAALPSDSVKIKITTEIVASAVSRMYVIQGVKYQLGLKIYNRTGKFVTTAIVLSIVAPVVTAATLLSVRGRMPKLVQDIRGIALQTVIIMVVLLAVAGGVAAVLLSRGGEAVTDIERQEISRSAADFSGSALCEAAGFTWNTTTSTCV